MYGHDAAPQGPSRAPAGGHRQAGVGPARTDRRSGACGSRLDSGSFAFTVERATRGRWCWRWSGARTHLPEGVEIEVASANGLPAVTADPDMLRQVLEPRRERGQLFAGGRQRPRVARPPRAGSSSPSATRASGSLCASRSGSSRSSSASTRTSHAASGAPAWGCTSAASSSGARAHLGGEGEGSTFFFELPAVGPEESPEAGRPGAEPARV